MRLFGREIKTRRAVRADAAALSAELSAQRRHAAALEAELQSRAAEVEGASAAVAEIRRVISQSPMMGMPVPGMKPTPGLPLYQFDYPFRYSTPQAPQRRPDSPVTLDMMRQVADGYDVLRSCINHLKREVNAVPCNIVAKKGQKPGEALERRIAEAERFFLPGGGLGGVGRRMSQFEAIWIEDLLVVGATSWWFRPTRGGGLYEVLPIDAATIRPRVDAYGWPGPSEKVWEQWIYGVQVAAFERSEMVYDGMWPVSFSPYFKSSVEWILATVATALKADEWDRTWLTHGTAPSDAFAAPEDWTPSQIREYYELLSEMLSGNTAERVKLKLLPGGSGRLMTASRRDQQFAELSLFMIRRTCSIMGVQPASIGYVGEQYKVSQDASMDQTSAFGVGQILEFRKARYDDILQRLGYEDLEVQNVTGQEEAAKERAERLSVLVGAAIMKPNEARAVEGLDPDADGDVLLVASGITPLGMATRPPAPETAPDTGPPGGKESALAELRSSSPGEGVAALKGALVLWERKAVKRIKEGRSAMCRFESEEIPEPVAVSVRAGLAEADSVDAVRRLFRELAVPDMTAPPTHVAPIYVLTHTETAFSPAAEDAPFGGASPSDPADPTDPTGGPLRSGQAAPQATTDRITGWMDLPLSPHGVAEARAAGDRLRSFGITRILTSDLTRARQTAREVAPIVDATVTPEFALRPWHLGIFEGEKSDERLSELLAFIRDRPAEAVPGGESWETFSTRLLSFVARAMQAQEAGGAGPVLLVTHSRCFELIRAWVLSEQGQDANFAGHFQLDGVRGGSVLCLSLGPSGWVCNEVEAGRGRAEAPLLSRAAADREAIKERWRARRLQHEIVHGPAPVEAP